MTMKKSLMMLALLLTAVTGAWADEWATVYTQTQTKQSDWTALSAGSTTGKTLGSAGNTTYYYVTSNLSFTNSTEGGSGLTILGTVYLYVPEGKTVTCTGANASGQTGGGAGIELSLGNSLYLIGGGTLNATGGKAANGGNGGKGVDSGGTWNEWTSTGSGGSGGYGGGGAGAGIGTHGGNGGNGGAGGSGYTYTDWKAHNGTDGISGSAGSTVGAMGALYVYQATGTTVNATGGTAGSTGGSGGDRGRGRIDDEGYNYSVSGGGGGGGGGFGGAASNIGTGGPGGGGGGGGAGGAQDWKSSGYYDVTAYGGHGGQNANGTFADDGTEALTSRLAMEEGLVDTNSTWGDNDANSPSGDATFGNGGAGGAAGSASTSGSAINLVDWPTSGAGTEESPYLISSVNEWNSFAGRVYTGNSYSGKHIKLTTNISVTTMAGGYHSDENYHPFSGTFDGDGHTLTLNVNNQSRFAAPFKCVSGAIIKNLRTAGTIDGTGNADGKLLAGLAGICFSSATITNCRSSVTLTTNFGEDAAMAGIVAGTKGGSLTIEGCVFDGTMTGSTNTRCAGIAGYEYIATTTVISNTLFAPTTLTVSTADDSYTKTFTRDPDATITNCYYTQPLGAAQGTEAIFTSQAPSNIGTETADYGMVKAYENGLYFDGKYYFAPSTSTGAGTEGDPYIIGTTGQWDTFAAYVNNGNNYSGKFVRLTADISVSTMMGLRGDKPFSGTFLGGGHTITANIVSTTTGTGVNEQGVAPFHYIKDATIKNLKVAGTIASASYHTGGLVGFADGTNLIENCAVTATLNISSDYAGGIIGHGLSSTTTIQGCAFAGAINGVDGNRSNIGGIWGWSTSGTPSLLNCLENGTYTNIASMHPMGLQSGKGTITNCYYMNPQVGSPQNACTVSGAKQAYTAATAPANLGNLVQNYGIVKAYANGILFDGKYYVAPATVTLADGSDNTAVITGADGYVANVTLANRTLYKDGAWNTICLPFNVTIAGSPLAGATARPLTSASISGTTLTLTFGDAVTTLEAGTPYIIKWAKADGYDEASEETRDLKNPVFSGVTIDSDMHPYDTAEESVTTDERVRFVGTYKSTAFNADDKSILLMGSENTLYYPTAGAGIGAQRAYFKIGSDGALLARRLTAFNIDFGDDETTGIISVHDSGFMVNGSDAWFTLDGRRLSAKPSVKGVYVNNGRKVVIK